MFCLKSSYIFPISIMIYAQHKKNGSKERLCGMSEDNFRSILVDGLWNWLNGLNLVLNTFECFRSQYGQKIWNFWILHFKNHIWRSFDPNSWQFRLLKKYFRQKYSKQLLCVILRHSYMLTCSHCADIKTQTAETKIFHIGRNEKDGKNIKNEAKLMSVVWVS